MLLTFITFTVPVLTVITFLPQLVKIFKTKHTRDISLPTFVIIVCGASEWIAFGLLKHEPLISVTNILVLISAGLIVIMKLKYG